MMRAFTKLSRSMSSSAPTLPRLPVPPLRKTLDRYLQSIQPFLLEDEARGGTPYEEAYTLRKEWADAFERGPGTKAQEKLIALDKSPSQSPHNWLDDSIWMKKAYHESRAPLPVNSNWWLTFVGDDSAPVEKEGQDGWAGVTPWQVRRAAWLIWRVIDFKERLKTQELYPETTRTGIWLRDSTAKIFNTCRVPLPSCDALSPQPQTPSPHTDTLLVMVHDWMYTVSCEGKISHTEIENRLREVARDAERRLESGEQAVPVGVLSADGRDRWAENYTYLRKLSPINGRTLDTIHQSLLALSLDHYTYTLPPSSPPSQTYINPHQPSSLTPHLHNTRSPPNAHNRFYDKPLTLILESDGRAGAMGEHSVCDALVPSVVCEWAVAEGVGAEMESIEKDGGGEEVVGLADDGVLVHGKIEEADVDPDLDQAFQTALSTRGLDVDADLPPHPIEHQLAQEETPHGWERLDWVTDDRIEYECKRVEEDATAIIADSDDAGLWFGDYGADWVKNVAKLSPDAYIQMALQLAWYKTRGEFTATYETALTRMFAKGRTETIRTLTVDSRAWVLSMLDPNSSPTTRRTLLHRAIQTHASLTRAAATGKGIDRHLLGLRLMLSSDDGPCQLLEDELFERSQRWKLSTSGLSAGHQFHGTGFGAAFQDGYGINYLAGPDVIKFGIESKHSSPLTSTNVFIAAVSEALLEMKAVCSVDESSSPVVSHL